MVFRGGGNSVLNHSPCSRLLSPQTSLVPLVPVRQAGKGCRGRPPVWTLVLVEIQGASCPWGTEINQDCSMADAFFFDLC